MPLPVLAGNERIKAQLSLRERGRGLSHAYLIAGPAGSGRSPCVRRTNGAQCAPRAFPIM